MIFIVQQQKSGQNEWRTLQLVLPVSDPHQSRTLYLCHGSGLGSDPQGPTHGGPNLPGTMTPRKGPNMSVIVMQQPNSSAVIQNDTENANSTGKYLRDNYVP